MMAKSATFFRSSFDFNLQGLQGFLAFEACEAEHGSLHDKLHVGQLVETVVTNADNPATLHLSSHQAPVSSAVLTEHDGLDMGEIMTAQCPEHLKCTMFYIQYRLGLATSHACVLLSSCIMQGAFKQMQRTVQLAMSVQHIGLKHVKLAQCR